MVYHRLASLNKNEKYDSSNFYFKLKLIKGKFFFRKLFEFLLKKKLIKGKIDFFFGKFFSTNLHYYSIIYFSNYQIVPAVKCAEKKGCEYKIQIVNEIDDLRYAKVSYGKNIHKFYDNLNSNSTKLCYAFNVDDENINSIKIELNSMYFI